MAYFFGAPIKEEYGIRNAVWRIEKNNGKTRWLVHMDYPKSKEWVQDWLFVICYMSGNNTPLVELYAVEENNKKFDRYFFIADYSLDALEEYAKSGEDLYVGESKDPRFVISNADLRDVVLKEFCEWHRNGIL